MNPKRTLKYFATFLTFAALAFIALPAMGQTYMTDNFVVQAPTRAIAIEIAEAAERYRHDLAVEWLGKAMPQWTAKCTIVVRVGRNLGAGGATSFVFDDGEVFGWRSTIQGSRERILDSVLPHEILHTIFASHFRAPVPRWADEGACTTVEHASRRAKQHKLLIEFLRARRGISFDRMLSMKQYPRDVLPLYAQGYSLSQFLLYAGGKQRFLSFVGGGMQTGNWPMTVLSHYEIGSIRELQDRWLDWVKAGSPAPVGHTVGFRGPLRNWLFGNRSQGPQECYGPSCWAPQASPLVGRVNQPLPLRPRPIPPIQPRPPVNVQPVDKYPEMLARIVALESLAARLATLKMPEAIPGPPGERGPVGPPGDDGEDGKTPVVNYETLSRDLRGRIKAEITGG